MRSLVVIAVLLLEPSLARADWVSAPPCARCQLEGPGEYCKQYSPNMNDGLGCQSDSANPRPGGNICKETTLAAQDACCSAWQKAGWRFECVDINYGAVWCRTRQAGDPPPTECPGPDGCAIGRSAAVGSATGALILALFAIVRLIRRRRATTNTVQSVVSLEEDRGREKPGAQAGTVRASRRGKVAR